jgi:hypothetical protein
MDLGDNIEPCPCCGEYFSLDEPFFTCRYYGQTLDVCSQECSAKYDEELAEIRADYDDAFDWS